MALRNLLIRFFRPKAADAPTNVVAAPVADAPVTGPAANVVAAPPVADPTPFASSPYDAPAWLDDDDLLRDEGVLYGLTGARPDERVAAIRHFFAQQAANAERAIEQYTEKIGELNLFIEQQQEQLNALRQRSDELATRPPAEHQLPRTAVGLALAVVMAIGNFFLIDAVLAPAFVSGRLVAIGVFLAGMLGAFGRLAPAGNGPRATTFGAVLTEVGLPFAASLLVLAQALPTQPMATALALFGFVFFLFWLAGKLLPALLTQLPRDWQTYRANRELQTHRTGQLAAWRAELEQKQANIDQLRVQKWQIQPALNRAEAERTHLHARRDWLINLFLGEYELAASLRSQLTDAQRAAILRR